MIDKTELNCDLIFWNSNYWFGWWLDLRWWGRYRTVNKFGSCSEL